MQSPYDIDRTTDHFQTPSSDVFRSHSLGVDRVLPTTHRCPLQLQINLFACLTTLVRMLHCGTPPTMSDIREGELSTVALLRDFAQS